MSLIPDLCPSKCSSCCSVDEWKKNKKKQEENRIGIVDAAHARTNGGEGIYKIPSVIFKCGYAVYIFKMPLAKFHKNFDVAARRIYTSDSSIGRRISECRKYDEGAARLCVYTSAADSAMRLLTGGGMKYISDVTV